MAKGGGTGAGAAGAYQIMAGLLAIRYFDSRFDDSRN
jgi:hypothetical protein